MHIVEHLGKRRERERDVVKGSVHPRCGLWVCTLDTLHKFLKQYVRPDVDHNDQSDDKLEYKF